MKYVKPDMEIVELVLEYVDTVTGSQDYDPNDPLNPSTPIPPGYYE